MQYEIVDDHGNIICMLRYEDHRSFDQAHADARLIAAAPEMLETLKTLIAEAQDLNANGDIKLGSEFYDMIQQTISKINND